jgi:hypothetical protein
MHDEIPAITEQTSWACCRTLQCLVAAQHYLNIAAGSHLMPWQKERGRGQYFYLQRFPTNRDAATITATTNI